MYLSSQHWLVFYFAMFYYHQLWLKIMSRDNKMNIKKLNRTFSWQICLTFLLLIEFCPDKMTPNSFAVWQNDISCSPFAKWAYLEIFLLLKCCSCAVWRSGAPFNESACGKFIILKASVAQVVWVISHFSCALWVKMPLCITSLQWKSTLRWSVQLSVRLKGAGVDSQLIRRGAPKSTAVIYLHSITATQIGTVPANTFLIEFHI